MALMPMPSTQKTLDLDLDAVIITLDRSNAKRAQRCYRNAIERLGFDTSRVRFLDATRGSALTVGDVATLVTPRAQHELKHGRYCSAALSGYNSVGCFLSHREAWQQCADSNRNLAIMEDDYVTRGGGGGGGDFASTYIREMPQSLGGGDGGGLLRCGYHYDRLGAEFYIVSPDAARALLRFTQGPFQIDCHVDHFLNFMHEFAIIDMTFSKKNYYSILDLMTTWSTISHNSVRWNVAWWKLAALCTLVSAVSVAVTALVLQRRCQRRR